MESTKFNILVVDDNLDNIKLAASLLQNENYDILIAYDGEDALKQFDPDMIDLILLDVMMPGLDGFEVCRRIKKMPEANNIPIIFLTARNDIDSIIKGFQLGAVDFITKPFNGAELMARVRTHLELKLSKQRLAEANATKDKFFSIIAHDLKNPVGSLRNVLELLYDSYDTVSEEDKKDFVQMLFHTSSHLQNLLLDLLTWSRSQTGKIAFNPDKVKIKAITGNILRLLELQATDKNIKLVDEIDSDFEVYIDINMINTVFRNILSNSIKFTPENGQITISSEIKKNHAIIKISDTGVGMSQDIVDKLFKIENTKPSRGTKGEKGTGLGLIIAKEFVLKNGGEIWAESKLGEGSTFYFSLPLSD